MTTQIPDETCLDGLRISDAQYRRLVDAVEAKTENHQGRERRKAPRVPYIVSGGIMARIRHFDGSLQKILVRPRNLSSSGIAFFHGSFVYRNTHCLLHLRTRNGSNVLHHACIMRCRHVAGQVHEVGARFDQPIDVDDYIGPPVDEAIESSSPAIEKAPFSGTVLCVSGNPARRTRLKSQLQALGLSVTEVDDGPEAIESVMDIRFDVVIAASTLPSMLADDLFAAITQEAFQGVMVSWGDPASPGPSSPTASTIDTLPPDADDAQVHALLGRHLPCLTEDQEVAALQSALWSDPKLQGLILQYLEKTEEQLMHIKYDLNTNDVNAIIATSIDMKGSAHGFGYPQISQAAEKLLNATCRGESFDTLKQRAGALIELCQRACAFRRDATFSSKLSLAG